MLLLSKPDKPLDKRPSFFSSLCSLFFIFYFYFFTWAFLIKRTIYCLLSLCPSCSFPVCNPSTPISSFDDSKQASKEKCTS